MRGLVRQVTRIVNNPSQGLLPGYGDYKSGRDSGRYEILRYYTGIIPYLRTRAWSHKYPASEKTVPHKRGRPQTQETNN